MPTWDALYLWRDNNGKRSQSKLTIGPGEDFAGAASKALTLVSFLAAVSDAELYAVKLVLHVPYDDPGLAAPGSDVTMTTVLFYRNGENASSILVPSVSQLHFEATGPYAGQRITRESASLSGVLPELDNLLAGTLDGAGRPAGFLFCVGGRTTV